MLECKSKRVIVFQCCSVRVLEYQMGRVLDCRSTVQKWYGIVNRCIVQDCQGISVLD